VKQLAALHCAPAFFEGEEGVFPSVVTDNLITDDPLGRERWFVQQYKTSLVTARRIAGSGVDAYVDNASPITIASYAAISPHAHSDPVAQLIAELESVAADVTVVLVAKPELLSAYIAKRGRVSEEVVTIAEQAVRVQAEFIRAARAGHVLLLDRTGLDFNRAEHLREIDQEIKAFIRVQYGS
jgi:hypothetical protein